jgi:hypothetical protein
MSDAPAPRAFRLDPAVAWTMITDAPLAGLALAREPRTILVWDEAHRVLVLDGHGARQAEITAPGRIANAAYSDDGTLVALLVEGPRLVLLDGELEPIADRPAASDSLGLGCDPHGRYVALSTKSSHTQLYTRYGKQAGSLETIQPVAFLRFVPDRPRLLTASSYGTLTAFELSPAGGDGELDCEQSWSSHVHSNIGRLAVTGDGGMILTSCYTHGIQRFDSRGRNEGAYHLGGTTSHAVPDFAGRTIAVATTEGELALLNGAGNVRWKTGLPHGPVSLECDALGRFLIYGLPTGEVVRLELEGSPGGAPSRAAGGPSAAAATRAGTIRVPSWSVPVAKTDEQAETAVVAVLDDPPRIGLITNRNQLAVYTASGGELGLAPEIVGVGRILRVAPGWIVAATDRQVAVHDARRNASQRLDLSLVEVTHLAIRPDTYGLAIVQERDRLGRASLAGRWVWKRELKSPVEELAIGPDALTGLTTEDGQLLIYGPGGDPAGRYAAVPSEPLALAPAPEGSPPEVAWLTLARHSQVVRGHRRDGQAVWESPVPWEPWQLHALSRLVVIEAPDGRALAFDGSGHARAQSRTEAPPGLFFSGPGGEALRMARQGMHLLCSDLSGRVHWRAVAEDPIGPMAAGSTGVAALIGRSLAWFPSPDPSDLRME